MRGSDVERVGRHARTLLRLSNDVLRCVLDELDVGDRVALGHSCRALHAVVEPVLYARIELASHRALRGLVRTLDARPALGQHTRAFVERRSFLYLATTTHDDADGGLLARALGHMPRLHTLRLRSPIETPLGVGHALRTLELGDATAETLAAVLPFAGDALTTLSVRRASAGWSDTGEAAQSDCELGLYLVRWAGTLRSLDVDGALLAAALARAPASSATWPRLRSLKTHGPPADTDTDALSSFDIDIAARFPALDRPPEHCAFAACCCAQSCAAGALDKTGLPARRFSWCKAAILAWMILGALFGLVMGALFMNSWS